MSGGETPGQELELRGPVVVAELVDDDRPGTAVERWRPVALMPPTLRNPAVVRQRMRDGAVAVLLVPWRTLRAVVRGLVHAARGWRRWVRVHDYRDAAEQAEKLADKYVEIRALTIFRWKVTAAVTVGSGIGLSITAAIYGPAVWWVLTGATAGALAWIGRRKDGAPGRTAVLAGPRSLTWTMDSQVLVDAFRDAKLIGKDETLRLVERSHRQGKGWAITVDLPATRKAADVIRLRDALASALAVDEVQLIVERVRGHGGHAGRVAMWVADEDPYAAPPVPTPLITAERWDAWVPSRSGATPGTGGWRCRWCGRRSWSVRSRGRARRSLPGWRRPG